MTRKLLATWERERERFIKVMPRDYRRVLEQRRDEDEADESEEGDPSVVALGG